jgi:hypothetical protein
MIRSTAALTTIVLMALAQPAAAQAQLPGQRAAR